MAKRKPPKKIQHVQPPTKRLRAPKKPKPAVIQWPSVL
jgi:hypothetical protein